MPDALKNPTAGPDGNFDHAKPVTRGQWHTIAVLACRLFGLQVPKSRFDAQVIIVRLNAALIRGDTDPRKQP